MADKDVNSDVEKKLQQYVEKQEEDQIGAKMTDVAAVPLPWQKTKDQISMGNEIGWQKLPIKDLPTKGLFYPEGSEVAIRSATAGEIRHWSTLQEDDLMNLDDMLNYILERCVSFKTPSGHSSWKDIKEVDRFYILLGVREYTFVKGENQLQVKTSETSKINVTKDMIDFINIDEKLMKYYDEVKRCFVLKFKTGKIIEVSIPSVGVTNFIKNYINIKQQMQEGFDIDFIGFAPFVLKDWRGVNNNTYEQMVLESNSWSIPEVSVLTRIRDLFVETVNPVVKYVDEGGMGHTAPLNFLGGIKSIFLISDPFGELV